MKKSLLAIAAAAAVPFGALADQMTINSPGTGSTATANVDVQVIVPAVLSLRVGAGTTFYGASGGSVNLLKFTVQPANIGDGSVMDPDTGFTGDIANGGGVTARVFSNLGTNVSFSAATPAGALQNARGTQIPWSAITVTANPLSPATPNFSTAALQHPSFNASAATLTPDPLSLVVASEAQWKYKYTNQMMQAGTYGGGGSPTANGRVVYTAVAN